MDNYISITVAKYALADVIDALRLCGIYDIAVTKEDNNLVVCYENNHGDYKSKIATYFSETKNSQE